SGSGPEQVHDQSHDDRWQTEQRIGQHDGGSSATKVRYRQERTGRGADEKSDGRRRETDPKGQRDNANELGIERPDEPQRNQESLTKIGHAEPRPFFERSSKGSAAYPPKAVRTSASGGVVGVDEGLPGGRFPNRLLSGKLRASSLFCFGVPNPCSAAAARGKLAATCQHAGDVACWRAGLGGAPWPVQPIFPL